MLRGIISWGLSARPNPAHMLALQPVTFRAVKGVLVPIWILTRKEAENLGTLA